MSRTERNGASLLRAAVDVIFACPEAWSTDYTAAELLAITEAHIAASWDYLPDTWEPRQIREAIAGIVPRWSADGTRPEYGTEVERVTRDPQPADLDAKIDAYVNLILTTLDDDGAVKLARIVDTLLAYRADRERRAAGGAR